MVASSSGSSAGDLLSGLPFRGIELPPGVAVGLALVLLLLLLSPGLRGASRWRVLLVPTRALATATFFWLALLPPGLAKAALPGDVTLWHYHVDHLGSVHSITDAAGNLYRQTRYTAYGEVRGRYNGAGAVVAAEAALRHEFTGYQSEETSGLQYAGARYYLPELGVFASHDPADQFASPYAYGPGDPINGTDPTGTFFDLGLVLLGLSIAGVVANAIYTGIKTGSAEAGLDALATGLSLLVVSYVVSAGLTAGIEALAGETARQAYQAASTGYSGYGVGRSAFGGDTIGAVIGGLSLAFVAYGALRGPDGEPSHKTVSGQGGNAQAGGGGESNPEPRPLTDAERAFLENVTGEDFGGVTVDEGFLGEHWAAGQVRSDAQINVRTGFSEGDVREQLALLAHEALHIVDRRSGDLGNFKGFFTHLGASITGRNLYRIPKGGVGASYSSLNFEQRAVVLEATAMVMLGFKPYEVVGATSLHPKTALRLYGEYRAGKP